MENTNKEFSLTLNKLQVQILGGITAVLILIGSISTIALINTLRNNHNDFVDGMEVGKEEMARKITEVSSVTIQMAQEIISLQNSIHIEIPTEDIIEEIDESERWTD